MHREIEGGVFGQFGNIGMCRENFSNELDAHGEGMWKEQIWMWH